MSRSRISPEALEERRREALSAVRVQKLRLDAMAQRARQAGETADEAVMERALARLGEIEELCRQETPTDELESLEGDAEEQGQMRAV